MPNGKPSFFTRFSKGISHLAGRPGTFATAVLLLLAWAVTGPIFNFSDTWQLVVNTGTTIVTFLMVFLIQATQNRDTEALHLKLDEVIRTQKGAHNMFVGLEELDEEEIVRIRAAYLELADRARRNAQRGADDTDVPLVDVLGKRRQGK
jgi:low affinity Fe/Cu permease